MEMMLSLCSSTPHISTPVITDSRLGQLSRSRLASHQKTIQLSRCTAISPEGTAENSPGCQSWVNLDRSEC
jgi:hypothetical protein